MMHGKELLGEIKRVKTLADIGLLYCSNEYDKERYTELHQISIRILRQLSGKEEADFISAFPVVKDYPTAKVDIRALVLNAEAKILLVKESSDEKWSLPGGWGEIGISPKETVVKECKEETGLDVEPQSLLAVFDKSKHPHPEEAFYVYKMVFHCKPISTEVSKGFDVLDVAYFDIDHLPELSENRILKSQIELVYAKILNGDLNAYFD